MDALVRWLAFDAIVGNADGHAKNLSLVRRDGLRLAPFYDLVCTRSYDALQRRLAMSVGGERDPDRQAMAEAVLDRLGDAIVAARVGQSPAVRRMEPQIRKQARRWLRELGPARR